MGRAGPGAPGRPDRPGGRVDGRGGRPGDDRPGRTVPRELDILRPGRQKIGPRHGTAIVEQPVARRRRRGGGRKGHGRRRPNRTRHRRHERGRPGRTGRAEDRPQPGRHRIVALISHAPKVEKTRPTPAPPCGQPPAVDNPTLTPAASSPAARAAETAAPPADSRPSSPPAAPPDTRAPALVQHGERGRGRAGRAGVSTAVSPAWSRVSIATGRGY